MRRLPPALPSRGPLALLRSAALLLLIGVVSGGGCTVWYSTDHDDPGPCWDDDPDNDHLCDETSDATAGEPSPPEVAPELLSLADWALEPGVEAGRHPVGRVHDADGLSLPALWGPGPWGEDALVRFAHDVIAANPELLALPPALGTLRAGDVHAAGTGLAVAYEQVPPGAAPDDPALPGAAVWFLFDARLHLVEVRNRTLVPGDALLPPPRAAAPLSAAPPAGGSGRTPPR